MPALAGNALLAKLSETAADKVRYIAKNGEDIFKAEIIELFEGKKKKDGTNGAMIKPVEGPSEGKRLFIPVDRLKGMQGRQKGFSPAKKDSPDAEDEVESPAPKKAAAKKEETKTENKKVQKSPKNDEEFDLESAREELKDLLEVASDLAARLSSIAAFFENLEMGDGEPDSPAPEPEPKKGSAKAKRSSSKPRVEHNDEDEE